MTKTWQEEFRERFIFNSDGTEYSNVMQFITNIRKHDEEELIKMLSDGENYIKEPVENKKEEIEWYANQHFNSGIGLSKQIIKDYYGK